MIKPGIFAGWNFIRWLRLGIGAYFAVQAFETLEVFSGVIAAFFLYQAITNTGCCGAGACPVPGSKNKVDTPEGIELNELKTK